MVVFSAADLAFPQPEVLQDGGHAGVTQVAVKVLSCLPPQPHQRSCAESRVVILVAKIEAEADQRSGGAFGFFNVAAFAGKLMRLLHNMYVLRAHVSLAAFAGPLLQT